MPLRWGICGSGLICNDFTNALRLDTTETHAIMAVGASSQDKAEKFLQSHELTSAKAFGSYTELYNDPEIDVVYVGLVNHMHKAAVVEALNAGKHVLCEKPLGLNVSETQEMISVAKKHGKFLMEGFWSRCFPAYHQLRKELDAKTIGDAKILMAQLSYPQGYGHENKMKPEFGGGVLMSVGCYPVMLANFVFREKPSSVVATGFLNDTGVDDTISVTLKYSNNRMAQLMSSGLVETGHSAVIHGSNGKHIKIPHHMWCPTDLEVAEEKMCFPLPENTRDLHFVFPGGAGFVYEANCVASCIVKGKKECEIMPWSDTLEIAETCQEIRRQIEVKFPQDNVGQTQN